MNDCLIVYIEKDVPCSIDNEIIMQRFQNMKTRRRQLYTLCICVFFYCCCCQYMNFFFIRLCNLCFLSNTLRKISRATTASLVNLISLPLSSASSFFLKSASIILLSQYQAQPWPRPTRPSTSEATSSSLSSFLFSLFLACLFYFIFGYD